MKVRWNVKDMAEKRGIGSAYELSVRAGINHNTASALMSGRSERVDRTTLAKICRALQCTPGDLLVLEGDDEKITAFGFAVAY